MIASIRHSYALLQPYFVRSRGHGAETAHALGRARRRPLSCFGNEFFFSIRPSSRVDFSILLL